MRILLVGDAYSVFTYTYVKYTLAELGVHEIIIFDFSEEIVEKPEIRQYYIQKGITILPEESLKLGPYEKIVYFLQKVDSLGFFDVCHIHYLGRQQVTMGILLRKKCDVLIANYWGGDWNNVGVQERKRQKELLDISDYVVTDSMHIYDEINKEFTSQYSEKLRYIRFKQPVIEEINKKECIRLNEGSFLQNKYAIPKDKIKIVCGYSGLRRHKHTLILSEITKLSEAQKKQLFLIIPSTYGKQNSYVVELESILKHMDVEYLILTENLYTKDVVELREITDVFINIQDYDAYSATLVEYLYCNKIIICGKWLDYSRLEEKGAYLYKIDKPEELHVRLDICIRDIKKANQKFLNNRVAAQKFMEKSESNSLWYELFINKKYHQNIEFDEDEFLLKEAMYWSQINLKNKRNSEMLQTILMIDNLDKRIQCWLKQYEGKKIGVYGAGDLGKIMYSKLMTLGAGEVLVFDKNLSYAGWYPKEVQSPQVLLETQLSVLIITPIMYLDTIKEEYRIIMPKVLTILDWVKEICYDC